VEEVYYINDMWWVRSTTIIKQVLEIELARKKQHIYIYMETIALVCFIIFTTGTLGSIGVFVKEILQNKENKENKEIELIAFD
jgi:hypothetical protein